MINSMQTKKYKNTMHELQTRAEHSRSLEDAPHFQAIETLTELGLLIPVAELETYHGRVGVAGDPEWKVDPSFQNGGSDGANTNVNKVPTLYTGEEQLAQDFANARIPSVVKTMYWDTFRQQVRGYTPKEKNAAIAREIADIQERYAKQGVDNDYLRSARDENIKSVPAKYEADLNNPKKIITEMYRLEEALSREEKATLRQEITDKLLVEVHHIVITDPDATVIDYSFDPEKLDETGKKRFKKALEDLLLPVTEGSPVGFDHRRSMGSIDDILKASKATIIPAAEIADIVSKTGSEESVVTQLVAGYNAKQLCALSPGYLAEQFLSSTAGIVTSRLAVDGEEQDIPVNLEYVQRFFRAAHIVGVMDNVDSYTVGRNIDSTSFFDIGRARTEAGLEAERQQIWGKLGGMVAAFELHEPLIKQDVHPLLKLLQNPYAKPHSLLEAAKTLPGYKEIFEADAGNWEGFSLEEHTETVLRNFDENYAEILPVQLLAPMRLAIIAHDVGKPIAAAEGMKHQQGKYNSIQARDFMEKLGVEKKLANLTSAIIGRGAALAFEVDIRRLGNGAEQGLQQFARTTLQEYYGSNQVSDAQLDAFTEMCKILQLCDGGAYTSMATTRTREGTYRNAPSFNGSFASPVGLGKRDIRLRGAGAFAESDLTPSVEGPVTRIRVKSTGAQSGIKPPTLSRS